VNKVDHISVTFIVFAATMFMVNKDYQEVITVPVIYCMTVYTLVCNWTSSGWL